jgi:hypothetical protein
MRYTIFSFLFQDQKTENITGLACSLRKHVSWWFFFYSSSFTPQLRKGEHATSVNRACMSIRYYAGLVKKVLLLDNRRPSSPHSKNRYRLTCVPQRPVLRAPYPSCDSCLQGSSNRERGPHVGAFSELCELATRLSRCTTSDRERRRDLMTFFWLCQFTSALFTPAELHGLIPREHRKRRSASSASTSDLGEERNRGKSEGNSGRSDASADYDLEDTRIRGKWVDVTSASGKSQAAHAGVFFCPSDQSLTSRPCSAPPPPSSVCTSSVSLRTSDVVMGNRQLSSAANTVMDRSATREAEMVKETIEANPVVVFSKSSCPFCVRAKGRHFLI